MVEAAIEAGYDATDLAPDGREFYKVIAEMSEMTEHEVYTLFMSPIPAGAAA